MQSGIHKEGVLGLFVYNSYQLVCSNKHVIKKMFDLIFAAHKGYKNLMRHKLRLSHRYNIPMFTQW